MVEKRKGKNECRRMEGGCGVVRALLIPPRKGETNRCPKPRGKNSKAILVPVPPPTVSHVLHDPRQLRCIRCDRTNMSKKRVKLPCLAWNLFNLTTASDIEIMTTYVE